MQWFPCIIQKMEQQAQNTSKDYNAIRRVLLQVLVANLAITVLKIAVGFVTGTLAIIADGFHSLVDSSSNLIGLAAIRLASRPADEKYPYGYQRYETLGSLAIGGLLLAAAWEIGSSVINRLLHGGEPNLSLTGFILMGLTLPVNIFIVVMETRAGQKLKSEILLADATHTRSDLFVTTSVIASLVGIWLGWTWLDMLVASAVVLVILRAAYQILRNAASWLADIGTIDANQIEAIARSVPGVIYVHHSRSRGTPDAAFVDLHVKVAPEMSTSQAHAIATEVENRLKERLPGVRDALVHIEPGKIESQSPWEQLAVELRQIADGMGVEIHDLHIHINPDASYVIELHVEVPGDVSLRQAHDTVEEFEQRVKERWERVQEVIAHLEPQKRNLLYPNRHEDPVLEGKIKVVVGESLPQARVHRIHTHQVDGHISAMVYLGLDGDTPLQKAHQYAEDLERKLFVQLPQLDRVIIHIEPFEYGPSGEQG